MAYDLHFRKLKIRDFTAEIYDTNSKNKNNVDVGTSNFDKVQNLKSVLKISSCLFQQAANTGVAF